MMKIFKSKILVLALMLISFASFGQSNVKGVLVDAQNGETLIGASIVVDGTTIGTATALDGSFNITVPSGAQKLIFSYIGYVEETRDINITSTEEVDLGEIALEPNSIGLEEVRVISSFAKDRETPVAISTIKPEIIQEKLGTQEYPEILKSTPSVYATKDGGGFGDSRITMRGFDSNNIGVLINGVPINGMENGKVYWSNWAGLSDVTQAMQVQRGLGVSKLAIPSVGGTINILTRSTDAKQGGSVGTWVGNDGYQKQMATISTGLTENGWAITLSGSHTSGDGYIQGTSFKGWNYFANVSKFINEKHSISLTAFGAPQTHDQRRTRHTIQQYRDSRFGTRYNSGFGYRDGEEFTTGHNYYHKPQISLNHFWEIDETSKLSTVVYGSISTGGGRSVDGEQDYWLEYDSKTGEPKGGAQITPEGYLDYDYVIQQNAENTRGSQAYLTNMTNSHQWYGLLSSYEKRIDALKVTAGIDGRYYKGYHYKEISDLMGGEFALAYDDKNQSSPIKKVGDKVGYNSPGEIIYGGVFAQGEYTVDNWSAFVSASSALNNYRRSDYFLYAPGEQVADWQSFLGYTLKGGINYNLTKNHNVFANGGYISRAPYFRNTYVGYTNEENAEAKNEQIITAELGYGFQTQFINVKANVYYTEWNDRGLVRTFGDNVANIPGLNETHYGFELEGEYRPNKTLSVIAMFSIGDWRYSDDISFELYDDNQNFLGDYDAYLKDVHVGDAAQTTAALGVNWECLPKFRIGGDANYYGMNFAKFDPTNRTAPEDQVDSWQLPDAVLVDLYANYKFKLGKLDAVMYGKVNNLLGTEYIADATDGPSHDMQGALVYYGFGTTWSTGLKIKF